jgi:hypothetical protein
MQEILTNGWTAKDENLQQQIIIINRLKLLQSGRNLDKDFVLDTISWIDMSEIQLIRERGEIDSFSFEDDIFIQNQQTTLLIYTTTIEINNQIEEIIASWDNSSSEHRKTSLNKLDSLLLRLTEYHRVWLSESSQIIQQTEIQQNELDDLSNVALADFESFRRRSYFAWAGVVVGLALLLFSMFMVYKYSYSQKEKQSSGNGNLKRKN